MNPIILNGKILAKQIESELIIRLKKVMEYSGLAPVLATIVVGSDPASAMYVKMKGNACKRVGLDFLKFELFEETTTEQLIEQIEMLNNDDNVCGILLQHPVPNHIDEQKCFNSISLDKDVDGVNTENFGSMTMGLNGFKSATPMGIMTLLERNNISIEGKEVVVVGRSPILGKPIAMLMLNANATVTICHSKTQNLKEIVKRADIIVAAIGKAKFIQSDWVKDGAVLVDAGYNEGNVGDIDLENAIAKCSAYTPVPGGVGPMTIASLMEQTIIATERKYNL